MTAKYRKLVVLMAGGHTVPFFVPADQQESLTATLKENLDKNGHGTIALGWVDHRYLRAEAIVAFYFKDLTCRERFAIWSQDYV